MGLMVLCGEKGKSTGLENTGVQRKCASLGVLEEEKQQILEPGQSGPQGHTSPTFGPRGG